MKLNFWQVLGLLLILVGLVYVIYRETGVRPATPIEPVPPPTALPPAPSTAVPTH